MVVAYGFGAAGPFCYRVPENGFLYGLMMSAAASDGFDLIDIYINGVPSGGVTPQNCAAGTCGYQVFPGPILVNANDEVKFEVIGTGAKTFAMITVTGYNA